MYRIFGKVQDTFTRAVYGVEKQTSKMSFYSCVDKKINGDNIIVRSFSRIDVSFEYLVPWIY